MTPSTAILVPVLNRPQNVAPLVESIEAHTPEPHRTLFVVSEGDDAEWHAVSDAGEPWIEVGPPGTWAQKINAAFGSTEEPFVFLAADDLAFHDDWLDEALRIMEDTTRGHAKDGRKQIAVVGTNDACNRRTYDPTNPGYPHSTHSLVRRSYVDEHGGTITDGTGVVLHEGYPHDFADDELVETAKFRGVYAHAQESHVDHLHPLCGKAEMDATYRLGMNIGPAEGARVYSSRCHLWGGGLPRRLRKARTRRG